MINNFQEIIRIIYLKTKMDSNKKDCTIRIWMVQSFSYGSQDLKLIWYLNSQASQTIGNHVIKRSQVSRIYSQINKIILRSFSKDQQAIGS